VSWPSEASAPQTGYPGRHDGCALTIPGMQPEAGWHSETPAQSTRRFVAACESSGVDVASFTHPLPDRDGQPISADVAMFGQADATRLLVVVSGMHGVESLPGAAIQIGWIETGGPGDLPEDTAVLMVHQVNPWGCAFRRRFNEDNVDLNRNFLDFSEPLPRNDKYPSIHESLVPGGALGAYGERSGEFLGALVAQEGIEYVVDLLMAGQHQFSDGFGFGGQTPTWSNRLLEQIMTEHAPGRERVCYLEIHSGLGPYGYGQLISLQLDACLERTRDWFGQWVFNPRADKRPGEAGYREVPGHSTDAFARYFPDAEVTPVTLEMGTYPPAESLALLLEEHVLCLAGDDAPEERLEQVRGLLQEYHFPADPDWRCANWHRGWQVIGQAIAGLGNV